MLRYIYIVVDPEFYLSPSGAQFRESNSYEDLNVYWGIS